MSSTGADATTTEDKAFQANKARLFKGTIAVCAVYGFIAISILISMFFIPKSREILGGTLYAFSITFVIGAILIIAFLLIQVYMYAPAAKREDLANLILCPDYWQLQQTPEKVVNTFPEADRPFVKYSCVPQTSVYGATTAAVPSTPSGSTVIPVLSQFNQGKTDDVRMDCNRIYPAYLAMKDKKDYPNKPNTLRCDLSSRCPNMPWTNVCA